VDAHERLSLESVSEHTVIACEHIHRYEFAAALCGGLRVLDLACGSGYGAAILAESAAAVHGVDNDVATVDLAAATVGRTTIATFEVGDAVALLAQDLSASYDAIVCFEALEHLADLERAVAGLGEQAARGLRLVVSVPNSRAFDEHNEFHVTDFGYEEARALLGELPDGVMVGQFLTEGSLISPAGADELDGKLVHLEQAEPEYANHFLVTANVGEDQLMSAQRSRAQLVEAPVHNRYMRNLEVANAELRRRNNELARKMMRPGAAAFARAGSAAPSHLVRLNGKIDELNARVGELEALGDGQAEMILAQRLELLQLRQALIAPSTAQPPPGVLARVRRRLRG
jgi:2-polyprenyl-3-methyl-5-hydroxy-6-metoxy-1,4-benzoquinol methylase